MKTSSAKAKGRRCAQEAKEKLLKYSQLEDGDVVVTSSGETGEDLKLSPLAKKVFPFTFECKNVEKLNIWSALDQAESHAKADEIPAVVFKRNRSKQFVALDFEAFLSLLSTR